MGRRFITVSPTDKLLKLETPPYNNANTAVGFSFVSVGTMKVTEVLKEEEHKVPGAKPGDEFRIVLGKMRETPTPAAKELAALGANTEPRELKFRAILQFNPFAKTYTYVTADYGKPEDAGWLTNNIQ